MKRYLIIPSQDPFSHSAAEQHYALAHALYQVGANVHVFAYEGAVALAFAHQQARGNSVDQVWQW